MRLVTKMPIRFNCTQCGTSMSVPSSYAGKAGRCTKCKKMTSVPKAGEPGAEVSASDERPLVNTMSATVGAPAAEVTPDPLEQERLKLELERAKVDMERAELERRRVAHEWEVKLNSAPMVAQPTEAETDRRPRRTCDGCWNKILVEANVCRFCGKRQEYAGISPDEVQRIKQRRMVLSLVGGAFKVVGLAVFAWVVYSAAHHMATADRRRMLNPPPPRKATPQEIEDERRAIEFDEMMRDTDEALENYIRAKARARGQDSEEAVRKHREEREREEMRRRIEALEAERR